MHALFGHLSAPSQAGHIKGIDLPRSSQLTRNHRRGTKNLHLGGADDDGTVVLSVYFHAAGFLRSPPFGGSCRT